MTGARPAIERYTGARASARWVLALVRRHAYLLLKSWPRIASIAYYPTVTMALRAFLTIYLAPGNGFLRSAPGFFIAPVSGVYYPIGVLPGWLQPVANALPSSHVFEGMRAVLLEGRFPWHHFWAAAALNVFALALGVALFALAVRHAREHGALLQMGE